MLALENMLTHGTKQANSNQFCVKQPLLIFTHHNKGQSIIFVRFLDKQVSTRRQWLTHDLRNKFLSKPGLHKVWQWMWPKRSISQFFWRSYFAIMPLTRATYSCRSLVPLTRAAHPCRSLLLLTWAAHLCRSLVLLHSLMKYSQINPTSEKQSRDWPISVQCQTCLWRQTPKVY